MVLKKKGIRKMIFEEIVEVLDNPKRSGEGFIANFSAHDDKTQVCRLPKAMTVGR